MGCKRFFLKERKNVMFLNKIDLRYCLVVFFVVVNQNSALTRRKRFKTACDAGEQQRIQGNKVSRFYLKT